MLTQKQKEIIFRLKCDTHDIKNIIQDISELEYEFKRLNSLEEKLVVIRQLISYNFEHWNYNPLRFVYGRYSEPIKEITIHSMKEMDDNMEEMLEVMREIKE